MYNPNNFTLASSIFDINNQKNYLKEEDKPKDKFEGIMINAAAAAAVNFAAINNTPASSSQLNMTPLFSSAPNNINYKNITNNYPLNTIATTQFYNNYQNYFSPTTSFINSAFSTTKTLTTSKSELINFCGQQTKRERTKYTDSQLNYLENIFKNDKYPDGAKREDIAKILHLTDVKIQVWFKNRRAKMQNERKFEKIRKEAAIVRRRIENINNINEASTSFIKREDSIEDTEEEEPKNFKREIGEIKNKKYSATQINEQNELINKVIKESSPQQVSGQTKQIKQQPTNTQSLYHQNNFLPKIENNNLYLNQQWNNNSNYLINNNYLNNSNNNTDYYSLMQMAANNYFQPQTNNFTNNDFWSSSSPSSSSNYPPLQLTQIPTYSNQNNTTTNQMFSQLASYYYPNNYNNYFTQHQQYLPITQQVDLEQKTNEINTTREKSDLNS